MVERPASTRDAAPRAGRGVTQQGHGDSGDGVKAQGHQEGSGDGGGSAGACGALQEDGDHQSHDDELDTAVLATDPGHGVLHILDGAGALQGVQDDESSEDHEHDLQSFLDAHPQQGVDDGHVLLKGQAGDIEVSESQQHGPDKGHGGHLHGRLFQQQDTRQHQNDRADCQDKVQKFHT